jgi:hypothetical protein
MKLPGVFRFIRDAYRFTWDRLAHFIRTSELFPDSWDPAQDAKKVMKIDWTIRSDKDVNFLADLAMGAGSDANLTGFSGNKGRIKRIKCQLLAGAARAFDIWIYKTDTFQNADLDLDSFCAKVEFLAADGTQCDAGAVPQFYYDSRALDIPYEDLDGTSELHVSLVWRDGVGYDPTAPGTDRLIVEVEYEPAG